MLQKHAENREKMFPRVLGSTVVSPYVGMAQKTKWMNSVISMYTYCVSSWL